MNHTKLTTLIIITAIVGLLAYIVAGSKKNRVQQTSKDQSVQSISEVKIASAETPIFFYGNTCPHCADVEEWMKENQIEEKIKIVKKEVYDNRQNSQELTEVAGGCGLPTNSIGVPFLYAEGKCLIGTPDITTYLADQVKVLGQSPDASESGERSQE